MPSSSRMEVAALRTEGAPNHFSSFQEPNFVLQSDPVRSVHMNNGTTDTLGMIAGNRSLPLLFARQARTLGVQRLVAVAFEGETDPELAQCVDEVIWLKVGRLSPLIKAFTDRSVKQCVMVGQIAPKNLFDLRPDLRAVTMLLKLKERNAHTIF